MYLPPPVQGDMSNNTNWGSSFLAAAHTAITNFFGAITALSIGSMGTITHANISFYEGVYTTTPPWRGPGFKYPPKYRTVPLVDTVSGYAVKTEIASQRRRRMATTP